MRPLKKCLRIQLCNVATSELTIKIDFFCLYYHFFSSKSLISKLELDEYADQYVMDLNESIKRMLSFAITMLADSNIILLDGKILKLLKLKKFKSKLFNMKNPPKEWMPKRNKIFGN